MIHKPLGILMLETRFPRPVGDIGNPASFDYPVRYRVVRGASPARVVHERAKGLLGPFIEAGHALVDEGCGAITTSCGFLVLFQKELEAALPVPVLSSSLLQIPSVSRNLPPGRSVGVVTISADSLGRDHLRAAGAPDDTPIRGVAADGEFARRILRDEPTLDTQLAQSNVVEAAQELLREHPQVGALVLECTNMPPYRDAVRRATGLPVYDVLTAIDSLLRTI